MIREKITYLGISIYRGSEPSASKYESSVRLRLMLDSCFSCGSFNQYTKSLYVVRIPIPKVRGRVTWTERVIVSTRTPLSEIMPAAVHSIDTELTIAVENFGSNVFSGNVMPLQSSMLGTKVWSFAL